MTYILSDACLATAKPLVSASVIAMRLCRRLLRRRTELSRGLSRVAADGGTCATVGVLGTAVGGWAACRRIWRLHLLLGLPPSVLGRVDHLRRQAHGLRRLQLRREPGTGAFIPFIAPEAVTADDLVVDLRSLEEAP